MKKIYTLLMLLMLSVLLVACGSSGSGSKKEDKKTEEKKDKSKKKSKKDKKSKDEGSEDEDESKDKKKKKSSKTKEAKGEKIIDNEGYSMTVEGIDENGVNGYTVKVLVENKSSDTNYVLTAQKVSVDGVQVEADFYSGVDAGEQDETGIYIKNLKKYGLSEYSDIEIEVLAYNSEDITKKELPNETAHIYPLGKDKAGKFEYEIKATDQVLVDNEYVKVVYVGSEEDEDDGYSANIYIVNKTDTQIAVDATNVSINGYMADPLYMESVDGGKSAFTVMSWLSSDLEEAQTDKSSISNIEIEFDIYDEENSSGEHFFNDKVTITPQ